MRLTRADYRRRPEGRSIRDHILAAPDEKALISYFSDACLNVKPAAATRRAWQEAFDARKWQLRAQTLVRGGLGPAGGLLGANGKPIR